MLVVLYCMIVVPIVISTSGNTACHCQTTKTNPFRPKMSMNAEITPRSLVFLLERNETRRVRGTDTRSAVLDRLAVEDVSDPISVSPLMILPRVAYVFASMVAGVWETYYEMENSAK